MPRKCANKSCKKGANAILKRPKTEPNVLPEESNNVRGLYQQYSKDTLEKAMKAVKEDGFSCMKAAKQFSIPRSTLKTYIRHPDRLGVKSGRRRSIPPDIENNIVDQTISASVAGFPVTKKEFLLKMSLTVKKLNLETQFKDGVPGNDYWRALKQRRPDLAAWIRKSDNKNINLKKPLKEDALTKYFEQLEKLLTDLDLFTKPACIWNAGEVGIQYCSEPVKLLTKRGTRDIESMSGINKETLNSVLCISALGNAMPPLFVISKGDVRMMQTFTVHRSSGASVWGMQETEWKGDQILSEWFKDVFLKNCGPDRPQLLIMNSCGSQEMLDLLALAREESIHILSLPPCSSPWLEPLDRGVFLSFQKCCRKYALQFMFDNPNLDINHDTWPNIMCMVWDEVMRADVVMSAFEVTGIYPLNRDKIPQHAKKIINKEHSSSTATLSQSVHEDVVAASAISSQLGASSSSTVQKTFYHYGKGINNNPSSSGQYQTGHLSLSPQTGTSSANIIVSDERPANLTHHLSHHPQVVASASSSSSVPSTISVIIEEGTRSQVYPSVSNPGFMTSNDPASIFPVFNS